MNNKKEKDVDLNFNTTQYICFLYKEFQKYCEDKLKPYNLTNGLYTYLIFIYKKPGSTLNEISKALEIDKAYTTRAIKKLIDYGYVSKVSDENDSRAFNIYSTEKCDEVMVKMNNLFIEWEKIMLKRFSKEEAELLKSLLKKTNIRKDEKKS